MTVYEQDPLSIFLYALKAPETKRQYPQRLKVFIDYLGIEGKTLEEQSKNVLSKACEDPRWIQDRLISFILFQKERARKGEIAEVTVKNYYKPTKLFFEMNDVTLNWKKISKGLPSSHRPARDRAPTIEEIRKVLEYPDRRIKPIVSLMASCGMRLGAWDYLRWKHVTAMTNNDGRIIAAKLLIYAGDSEEYYTFCTPEAYDALKEWMDFRTSHGENITGESWLMRDLWQTTNVKHSPRGLAAYPRQLKSSGIKSILTRAMAEQGIRGQLVSGEKRHEWKLAHGFRKRFKTICEEVMRPINVELLMGHDIGISGSYYRPTERQVLEDYLKAVPLLTLGPEDRLKLQMKDLQAGLSSVKVVEGKLVEKEQELQSLRKDVLDLKEDNSSLRDAIKDMREMLKNPRKLLEISERK